MAEVKGGRGVTGMSFSGRGNLEKPSSNKLARELGSTFSKMTMANPIGRRYAEAIGPMKPKSVPRTFVPAPRKPVTPPAVVAKPVAKKAVVKPAAVVSNVTREKLSPTKTAPARMAVNPRTGNTTGFTTGKTTGTSVSKSGVATKTYQSAGDRMKANAMNRTNQPAGPMGGGGGSRGGSLGGGGASRTSSGGGNLGGARGRISEPGGSKR